MRAEHQNSTQILNGEKLTLYKTKKTMHLFDKFYFTYPLGEIVQAVG